MLYLHYSLSYYIYITTFISSFHHIGQSYSVLQNQLCMDAPSSSTNFSSFTSQICDGIAGVDYLKVEMMPPIERQLSLTEAKSTVLQTFLSSS